jgi:hypothetical protein
MELHGNCNWTTWQLIKAARSPITKGLETPGYETAVAQGFEPWEACTSHAFEACSLGRSDTPPRTRIHVPESAPGGEEVGK